MPSTIRYQPNVTHTEMRWGYWSRAEQHEEWTAVAETGVDVKALPVSSDGHSPTWWSAESIHVGADVPYITYEEHIPSNYDDRTQMTQVRYMSSRVGSPFNWGYLPGWTAKIANAEDAAITKARDGLRNKDSFNIGVAIAEARKTAEMLATTGGDMAMKLINFRRYVNSLRSGRDVALAGAGAWLQGKYGWGSLARDAFQLDAALRASKDEPQLIKSTKTVKYSDQQSGPWAFYRWEDTWKGRAKCSYTASLESEFLRDADSWGLINPASVIWERMPFSFCVDWLIPVGNTLSSLTATAGLKFEHGYLSTTNEGTLKQFYVPLPWEQLLQEGYTSKTVKRFDRKALGYFLPPRLYANENPFNTNKIITATALISQLVLGRK